MAVQFTGHLNPNEIFGSIYNMIISQTVFADPIAGGTYSSLVDNFRVDGTLYGDTKLYYSTDALETHEWGNDAEAGNLLALARPADPKCQKITIDQFRQIRLTVDNYLTKRAWGDEYAFSSFNSVMLGWLRNTKRIFDSTLVNAYVGTTKSEEGKQNVVVDVPAGNEEADRRLRAQTIATDLANLLVEISDISRDYNDYGVLRSYNKGDLLIVWNSEVKNEITKLDLPSLFHKDVFDNFGKEIVLPARYFGDVVEDDPVNGAADGSIRSLIEQTIGDNHYFPGDAIKVGDAADPGTAYRVNKNIAFKICHKDSVPFMSAFETGTSFFNPRSLTETHFLTFGYSDPEYLQEYPWITVSLNKQ